MGDINYFNMPEWAEVFVINYFPKLEIIQLPSLFLAHQHVSSKLRKNKINYFYAIHISKEDFESCFTYSKFKNLILLKYPNDNYLHIDICMTDLFKLANEIRRTSKMKAFI